MFTPRGLLYPVALVAFLALLGGSWADQVYISEEQINTVSGRLAESGTRSWELGTRAQAILELNATRYSVFDGSKLPPPSDVPSDLSDALNPYFSIASGIMANWTGKPGDQPLALMVDGSAADPASNGATMLLANWTRQRLPDGVADGVDYLTAAKSQLDFLDSDKVPKTPDGAISHRTDQLQLWSDFVYMVPPFLAYYGALTNDQSKLEEAYNQCKLYRNYLRDENTGLWRHVLLGQSGNDDGFWSTGNGWAAAGMLRVHATIKNSAFSKSMKNQMKDLQVWVEEVHKAMYAQADSTHIFPNYLERGVTEKGNFYDASGTALVAATVFRASIEIGKSKYLNDAQNSWDAIFSTTSTQADGASTFTDYPHFTQDGWLQPVVNPHSYGQEGKQSPEGQAFVVMLYAARRDWEENGVAGLKVQVGLLVAVMVGALSWLL
ncbi:hypothetical protein D9611_009663 [Ephemerocybe angulata]|uniref:Six-hairpin glycosidase-like protein n=1 Tax=Ephemerocybe angulata TaxID=980116 RepID=A0A8H5C5T5_9AGAR|nr:hypothetical protein D9611_009663 [Tulosesus angulatus]